MTEVYLHHTTSSTYPAWLLPCRGWKKGKSVPRQDAFDLKKSLETTQSVKQPPQALRRRAHGHAGDVPKVKWNKCSMAPVDSCHHYLWNWKATLNGWGQGRTPGFMSSHLDWMTVLLAGRTKCPHDCVMTPKRRIL